MNPPPSKLYQPKNKPSKKPKAARNTKPQPQPGAVPAPQSSVSMPPPRAVPAPQPSVSMPPPPTIVRRVSAPSLHHHPPHMANTYQHLHAFPGPNVQPTANQTINRSPAHQNESMSSVANAAESHLTTMLITQVLTYRCLAWPFEDIATWMSENYGYKFLSAAGVEQLWNEWKSEGVWTEYGVVLRHP